MPLTKNAVISSILKQNIPTIQENILWTLHFSWWLAPLFSLQPNFSKLLFIYYFTHLFWRMSVALKCHKNSCLKVSSNLYVAKSNRNLSLQYTPPLRSNYFSLPFPPLWNTISVKNTNWSQTNLDSKANFSSGYSVVLSKLYSPFLGHSPDL